MEPTKVDKSHEETRKKTNTLKPGEPTIKIAFK